MEAAQVTGDQIGSGLWLSSSSCQANKFVSRTASKPLASRFQSYVLAHPKLRPAVLRFAQGIHGIDFAMTRFAEGKPIGSAKKFVAALDDERAMDLAGKVVSEGFVLAVAVGVLAWEYDRNAKKDDDKRAKEEAYRFRVDERFAECQKRLAEHARQQDAILAAVRGRQDLLERKMQEIQDRTQPSRSLQRSGSGWLWRSEVS